MNLKGASIAFALVLCAFGALSCSKSSTPTTPAGESQMVVSVVVTNTAGAATLEDVQVLIDGAVLVENSSTTALSTYTLNGAENLPSGNHTLGVRLVNQTTTPNTYVVTPTIQIFNSGGTLVNTISPTPVTSSLATGGSDTFTFTI
jgi:hypothetical protein